MLIRMKKDTHDSPVALGIIRIEIACFADLRQLTVLTHPEYFIPPAVNRHYSPVCEYLLRNSSSEKSRKQ